MVADVLTVLSFIVFCMMKVRPVISQIGRRAKQNSIFYERPLGRFRLKTKPAGISWVLSFFLDRIYKKWYNKAVS